MEIILALAITAIFSLVVIKTIENHKIHNELKDVDLAHQIEQDIGNQLEAKFKNYWVEEVGFGPPPPPPKPTPVLEHWLPRTIKTLGYYKGYDLLLDWKIDKLTELSNTNNEVPQELLCDIIFDLCDLLDSQQDYEMDG